MNPLNIPVFTRLTECQDCYKCVRECEVKAIKIENNHASIIPELCIQCGHCVDVCPVKAKKIRDDFSRIVMLQYLKKDIVVSLAPSWITEFPGLSKEKLLTALKKTGFEVVSETALGAEKLNSELIRFQSKQDKKIILSTACPTTVNLIQKYYPEYSDFLSPFASPVIIHGKMLRKLYGRDVKIVFFSPCVSKKAETDKFSDYIDVSGTFADLRKIFERSKIDPYLIEPEEGIDFKPYCSKEGSVYPIEGGMISGLSEDDNSVSSEYISISGLKNIKKALADINKIKTENTIFLELLACEGGCVNGPGTTEKTSILKKRLEILEMNKEKIKKTDKESDIPAKQDYKVDSKEEISINEKLIQKTFRSFGKYSERDKLNCGGCGYDTCREFAKAVISGKAEVNMCLSYLRKRAQKKAEALLNAMPSGVVIVDNNLKIVEINKKFFDILNLKGYCFSGTDEFSGAYLEKLIPFSKMFKDVLETGEDIIEKDYHYNKNSINMSIFTIEKHNLAGCIIQDITVPTIQREQTISKAKKVIKKNLDMVQKISYLLGENAAEIDITLNSIIESTGVDEIREMNLEGSNDEKQ